MIRGVIQWRNKIIELLIIAENMFGLNLKTGIIYSTMYFRVF